MTFEENSNNFIVEVTQDFMIGVNLLNNLDIEKNTKQVIFLLEDNLFYINSWNEVLYNTYCIRISNLIKMYGFKYVYTKTKLYLELYHRGLIASNKKRHPIIMICDEIEREVRLSEDERGLIERARESRLEFIEQFHQNEKNKTFLQKEREIDIDIIKETERKLVLKGYNEKGTMREVPL